MVLDITSRVHAENELRRLNAELETRVSERTADLSAANEQLTELDRLKSKFVADVSHELRNPVASLNTRLYLLERAEDEDSARHIAILKEQLDRLNRLIGSVLNISRIELAKQTVKLVALDLNNVIENELRVHYPVAESKGLSLSFKPAPNLRTVMGEPAQLAQVVMNLVANAINYTESGTVEVRTMQDDGHVAVEVRDSGLGIAQEDMANLFDRFYRGRTAVEAALPGTGLGLSIVKEIIDLHQGQIEVESEVGKGTLFRVLLPPCDEPVFQSQNEPLV